MKPIRGSIRDQVDDWQDYTISTKPVRTEPFLARCNGKKYWSTGCGLDSAVRSAARSQFVYPSNWSYSTCLTFRDRIYSYYTKKSVYIKYVPFRKVLPEQLAEFFWLRVTESSESYRFHCQDVNHSKPWFSGGWNLSFHRVCSLVQRTTMPIHLSLP